MSYTDNTIKKLWSKSGGICAFPDCTQELVCDTQQDVIGRMCHIIGRKARGPRGDFNYDENDLDKEENIILLCPTHHEIIDSDTDKYTVEVLRKMKADHEQSIKQLMSNGTKWDVNVSQLYYINLPRLAILAGMNGFNLNFNELLKVTCLHSLKYDLNYVMLQARKLIKAIHINSIPLNDSLNILHTGQIVEFNQDFRTKNMPYHDKVVSGKYCLPKDINKAPHIYYAYDD